MWTVCGRPTVHTCTIIWMWFVGIILGEGGGVGAKLNRLRLKTNYKLMIWSLISPCFLFFLFLFFFNVEWRNKTASAEVRSRKDIDLADCNWKRAAESSICLRSKCTFQSHLDRSTNDIANWQKVSEVEGHRGTFFFFSYFPFSSLIIQRLKWTSRQGIATKLSIALSGYIGKIWTIVLPKATRPLYFLIWSNCYC